MKTILFKTIIIAFFVGTAVSCSDEDENRFRPGSTHEKPNPAQSETLGDCVKILIFAS